MRVSPLGIWHQRENLGSGGRDSSSGESEGKSSKGVSWLGKRMEGGGIETSSVGPGFGCSGGISEGGVVKDDDDSFLGAVASPWGLRSCRNFKGCQR
jgi:hypothetical protein